MKAAFDRTYVKNIDADNVMGKISKRKMLESIREDINRFKDEKKVDRLVMIWCASTEVFTEPHPVHQTLATFEEGLRSNHPDISPSMIYAYAALIWADFSGYSDIAIGSALLLGVRLKENFDSPYRSASLAEFWRRWHISRNGGGSERTTRSRSGRRSFDLGLPRSRAPSAQK